MKRAWLVLGTLIILVRPAFSAPAWETGATFDRYSGKYGTDDTIKTTMLSFEGKRWFGKKALGVTVPFVSVTSIGTVLVSGGRPVNPHGHGNSGQSGNAATAKPTETTNSGLGDVVVHGETELLEENEARPQITAEVFVKTPTGKEDKGLGTGEFDAGAQSDFYKEFTPLVFGSLTAGYTFVGSPPGAHYRNKWDLSVGAGRVLTKDFSVSLIYMEERAIVEGNKDPRELWMKLNINPKPTITANTGFMVGLSDGAPDVGFTLSGAVKF